MFGNGHISWYIFICQHLRNFLIRWSWDQCRGENTCSATVCRLHTTRDQRLGFLSRVCFQLVKPQYVNLRVCSFECTSLYSACHYQNHVWRGARFGFHSRWHQECCWTKGLESQCRKQLEWAYIGRSMVLHCPPSCFIIFYPFYNLSLQRLRQFPRWECVTPHQGMVLGALGVD